MARAFISVGSNIDPEKNMLLALRLLRKRADIRAISTVYLTEPIGRTGQSPYYNCVIDLVTDLPPVDLKQRVLRCIETELGRTRTDDKYGPRTIDLDLILYDEVLIKTDELVLPDPDILLRPFLAASLVELAPDLVLPGTGTAISDAAARMSRQGMTPLGQYTGKLRKDVLHEREQ